MLRMFLIRNGLSILYKDGPASQYRVNYLRKLNTWGTSAGKQRQLRAGTVCKGDGEEKWNPETNRELPPDSCRPSMNGIIQKDDGLIVFFPGMPNFHKHSLWKELLNAPNGLGDDRPILSLKGDLLMEGEYWEEVTNERIRNPYSILLVDKNPPCREHWNVMEEICFQTRAFAIPVVPDFEGTDPTNQFSLDALAVFMFHLLQRVHHPGNLDKDSPNTAGYVPQMFYRLIKDRSNPWFNFERDLLKRFGSLVKMPLLKNDRSPLPDQVRSALEEGIKLCKLEESWEYSKGSCPKKWAKWEMQLEESFLSNANYVHSVQVPFESAFKQVFEQLNLIAKGEYEMSPSVSPRCFRFINRTLVNLPVAEIRSLLDNLAAKDPNIGLILKDKDLDITPNVSVAKQRCHGMGAVSSYAPFFYRSITVKFTALLFDQRSAALEAQLFVDDQEIVSSWSWFHVRIWNLSRIFESHSEKLRRLYEFGFADRIEINPPLIISSAKLEYN